MAPIKEIPFKVGFSMDNSSVTINPNISLKSKDSNNNVDKFNKSNQKDESANHLAESDKLNKKEKSKIDNSSNSGQWVHLGKTKINLKDKYSATFYLRAIRKSYAKQKLKYNNEVKGLNKNKDRNLSDFNINKNEENNLKAQNNKLIQKLHEFNSSQSNHGLNQNMIFNKLNKISTNDEQNNKLNNHKLKGLDRKTSRVLKAEYQEHSMLESLSGELKKNRDELHQVFSKISNMEKDDKFFNELKSTKDLVKTQIEIINNRLSNLDHKESAIGEKINKLDSLSKSMKTLLYDVNDLISEKMDQNIRAKKLNEKINADNSNLRKQILLNERKLRELEDHYNAMKYQMSHEQKVLTTHKIANLKSKINTYKKYVPKSESVSLPQKQDKLLELRDKINQTISENHDLFDDSKIKELYASKNSTVSKKINFDKHMPIDNKVKFLPKNKSKKSKIIDFISKFF